MHPRHGRVLQIVGLCLLTIVAALLAYYALLRFQDGSQPEAVPRSPTVTTPTEEPSPYEGTPTVSASAEPSSTEPPSPDAPIGPMVVILGDGITVGDGSVGWVPRATEALGWVEVVNLSNPGAGYLALPRECGSSPCAAFTELAANVVDLEPDMVVVFGGTADGDNDIRSAASRVFTTLRQGLPDADLVGIAPVTTEEPAPYWLTMHARSVESATNAVDGQFIDLGRTIDGEDDLPSTEAVRALAEAIVQELE